MDRGMKVFDVKEFIQYIPGKCFLPFTEKVVKLRVEATHENDDAKQLTAKLFGNSGYYTYNTKLQHLCKIILSIW